MNNDKQPKWSGKTQPNGRQPDHQNQSGPPDESSGESETERLPTKVVEVFQDANRHDLPVPDSVRAAILNDAADVLKRTKNQAVKSKPLWSRRSWMGISAGVLASALLFALVLPRGPQAINGPVPSRAELADVGAPSAASVRFGTLPIGDPSGQDVDGNGQVNILDAFLLAKSIERTQSSGQFEIARLDQNGDGVVNADDVNSIAMSVVML